MQRELSSCSAVALARNSLRAHALETECTARDSLQNSVCIAGKGCALSNANTALRWDQVPPSSTEEYRAEFLVAMDAYLGGDNGVSANWQTARVLLQLCITKCPQDGAAKAILEFIDEHCQADGMQPAGWCGYRRLEAK